MVGVVVGVVLMSVTLLPVSLDMETLLLCLTFVGRVSSDESSSEGLKVL